MSEMTEAARVKAQSPAGNKLDQGKQFYRDVKTEMKKVTWPTRQEVMSTTLVVLISVIFFGVFLWGADVLIALSFEALTNLFK